MEKRKFYVMLQTGNKFQISELDFNNLEGRLRRGQVKGFYYQRGENCDPAYNNWAVQIEHIAMFYADQPERKNEPVRNLDLEKHKNKPVGKPAPKEVPDCDHNWSNPDHFEYVTQVVNGVNRYYKMCNKCGAKSTLIKKREVEVAMEASGGSINDVPLVK